MNGGYIKRKGKTWEPELWETCSKDGGGSQDCKCHVDFSFCLVTDCYSWQEMGSTSEGLA